MIYSNNTYDITNDISTYTRTDFNSVYDTTRGKWYMLNNLDTYEEYGIYGTSLDDTKYVGKLVEVNDHEYEWDGTEWVDLGTSITVVTALYRDAEHNGYITFPYTTSQVSSIEATIKQGEDGSYFIATGATDRNDWRSIFSGGQFYYDCGNGRWNTTSLSLNQKLHLRFDGKPMRLYNYDTSSYLYTRTSTRPTERNFYWGYQELDFEETMITSTPSWLYDVVLYSDNGTTAIAHYIPYIQNGVAGLYDTINESFLAPTGTISTESEGRRPKSYATKAAPTITSLWASKIYRNTKHYTKLLRNNAEIIIEKYKNENIIKKGKVISELEYSYIQMTANDKGGIVTDYFINNNTSKIEIKFYDYSNVLPGDYWQYGFGIRNAFASWNSGPSISAGANSDNHLMIFDTSFDRNTLPTINFNANETAIYTVNFKQNTFNGNINGIDYQITIPSISWGTTTVPFGICCMWIPAASNLGSYYTYYKDGIALCKQADYALQTKIAYCKIWEGDGQGNDTLVRWFVPFIQNNEPCMKDKVNGTICYSSEPSYTEVGND